MPPHPEKILDRRFNNPSGPVERDICGKWGTAEFKKGNKFNIYCNDKPAHERSITHSYKNARGFIFDITLEEE